MKRIATYLAAALLSAGTAFAADPYERSTYTPDTNETNRTWTGINVGVFAALGIADWDGDHIYEPLPEAFDGTAHVVEGNGFMGGISLGADYQVGNVVFGVEGDAALANVEGNKHFLTSTEAVRWDIDHNMTNLFTLRGRLGYAQDTWMVWLTGGAAWAEVESNLVVTHLPDLVTANGSSKDFHTGYVVGTGIAKALSERVSIRFEYLYVDLGDKPYSLDGTTFKGVEHVTDSSPSKLDMHIAKVGLNYRF